MGEALETERALARLSLLFAAGDRPSATDVVRLLDSGSLSGEFAQVSHRPNEAEGRLELIASGLTLDLTGLAPAAGSALPPIEHQFGISLDPSQFRFEAITIAPRLPAASDRAVLEQVRAMVRLAAEIALSLSVKAVCWQPAQSWMEPKYFTRVVLNWLSGGAFPVLGLTAIIARPDGSLESKGLRFFTGQELRMEALPRQPRAETMALAVRIIDHIVRHGPVQSPLELEDSSGEPIVIAPSPDGQYVEVQRRG